MAAKTARPSRETTQHPILSIDFGNSYTKVAIRSDWNEQTTLYSERNSLKYDEDFICIPTLAARVKDTSGREQWHFGTQVSNLSDSPRVRVFRNWKPKLFKGVETHLPVEETASSPGSTSNPIFESFTNEQLQSLLETRILIASGITEVRAILNSRQLSAASVAEEADFEEIAVGYFKWLRTFVEPECGARNLGSTCEIPVRITMPSFGVHAAGARQRLVNILMKAGWVPAEMQPALAEPVANIFGIVTEGRNKTWSPPGKSGRSECPTYAGMFPNSALYHALRNHALGKTRDDRRIYWAMVVDVGGYTTDFAMIGFDLDDIEERIKGEYQGKPRTADFSQPLGVYDLDKRVTAVLSKANQAGFEKVVSEVDNTRVDRLHRQIYQEERPYDTGQGLIGKTTDEKTQIDKCIEQFASEVADLARRFRLLHQYDRIDELILTGGGFNITKVRNAVCKELGPFLRGSSHVPADDGAVLPNKCSRLGRILVRGATAIGGASVIFDFSTDIA